MTVLCDNCSPRNQCTTDKNRTECKYYQPQTNEEWLHTLNTEQLAEWIASVVQKAISIKESNGIVMLESAIWWGEWLKQPHTPKE